MMLQIIAATLLAAQAAGSAEITGELSPLTEGVRDLLQEGQPVGAKLGPMPEILKEPLEGKVKYGTFKFDGDTFALAVRYKDDGTWQFALDVNLDGRLDESEMLPTQRLEQVTMGSDDKPFKMVTYAALATLKRRQGEVEMEYSIALAASESVANSPAPKDTVVVVRNYARSGSVTLAGRTYAMILDEPRLRGNFEYGGEGPSEMDLYMDFNGDGKYNPFLEKVPIERSFLLNGEYYKVGAIDAAGTKITFLPTDDTPTFYDTGTGAKLTPFTATTLDGKTLRFPEDFKGKKVVFFFWGTWVSACSSRMRRISFILDQYAERGMAVIGVNVDTDERKEMARRQAARDLANAPHIFEGAYHHTGPIARRLGATNIPAMMIVDADTMTVLAGKADAEYGKLATWLKKFWPDEGE